MSHIPVFSLFAGFILAFTGHSPAKDFAEAESRAKAHGKSAAENSSGEITKADLKQYVNRLASREYEGRGTADRGGRMATAFLAGFFEKLGLTPAGDKDSYYQYFPFSSGKKLTGENVLEIHYKKPAVRTHTRKPGEDYQPLGFSPSGKIKATPAVFCGFGIKTDGYDSFKGLEVKDRWVIVFRGSPKGKKKLQRFGPLVDKARNAKKLGALGIIFIKGPNPAVGLEVIPPSKNVGSSSEIIPAICISNKLAPVLLTGTDDIGAFKELFNKYHSAERTVGFPIDCQVSAEIGLQKASEEGRNVIAHLQVGEKPSNEKIMIGAHIDHLGYGKRGSSRAGGDRSEQLHPGADDNASGVAAIMEIAQFFADKKRNGDITLKRDLVFAGWSGEEMGLFGSKHYVAKAGKNGDLYPKTAAYLNMDMVGRLGKNPLNVMATGSSKDWKGIIDSLDKELKIKISPNPNLPTDSTSFYSGGVPVIALFTGLHDEYHTPDDTPDKIDFNGLNRITHYLENLTSTVANLDAPPTYLKSARREEQKPTKLVIGVRIENVADNGGVKILETLPGSPAQKAGIRKGDIIEQIDGRKTNDIKGLREALNKLEAGKQYSTGVKRGNKLMLLEMTPEKSR
ncbi:MAG: M28 family peptidase [Verrucomicrobiales bacterium]|nr:M28 family peptidase [Verrucomicrobiales bacterium]